MPQSYANECIMHLLFTSVLNRPKVRTHSAFSQETTPPTAAAAGSDNDLGAGGMKTSSSATQKFSVDPLKDGDQPDRGADALLDAVPKFPEAENDPESVTPQQDYAETLSKWADSLPGATPGKKFAQEYAREAADHVRTAYAVQQAVAKEKALATKMTRAVDKEAAQE